MRGLNKALLCFTAFLMPLNAMAIIVAPLAQRPPSAPSQTMQLLAEDPLLIHQLDISEEEKEELLQQLISQEQEAAAEQIQEENLLHKANFFENLFGGGWRSQNDRYAPQYSPQPRRPQPAPRGNIVIPKSPPEPAIVFNHDDMRDPNDWKVKYFDVVVVINKAVNGQNATVYRKTGLDLPMKFKSGLKVSTGREIPELSNDDRSKAGMPLSDHAPTSSYFSNTPTGYFTPFWLHIAHVSGDWEDAAMDHSIFFHPRGIATHRAPVGTEGQLGRRASGACVRMRQGDARELFWLVRGTGGPVTDGELAQRTIHCNKKVGHERQYCLSKDQRRAKPSFKNELKLAEVSGFSPYAEAPQIPEFSREGQLKIGADGQPVMKQGAFKTLIVVENRPVAKERRSR